MVEWGRLLSGYRGEILGRRFESCPPRHEKRVPAKSEERVFIRSHTPLKESKSPDFEIPTTGVVGLHIRNYLSLDFIPKCVPLNPNLS